MSLLIILALIPAAVALVCWMAWGLWDARRQYKADMDLLDKWATEQEARFKEVA